MVRVTDFASTTTSWSAGETATSQGSPIVFVPWSGATIGSWRYQVALSAAGSGFYTLAAYRRPA